MAVSALLSGPTRADRLISWTRSIYVYIHRLLPFEWLKPTHSAVFSNLILIAEVPLSVGRDALRRSPYSHGLSFRHRMLVSNNR